MKNYLIYTFSTIALFCQVFSAFCQEISHKDLTSKFLDIVEENAYRSDYVNWDSLRPIIINEATLVKNESELEPIFDRVLKLLKDYHSSIIYAADGAKEENNNVLKQYATLTYEKAGSEFPNLYGEMIDDVYAYLNIPGVILEHKKYIQRMGDILQKLDAEKPKAWIFDITENNGGSIAPMLWQMYAFIDDTNAYSSVDRHNKETSQKKEMWDTSNLDEEDIQFFEWAGLSDTNLKPIEIQHTNIPIIVLTSPKTASSGEFVAAAFKGQRNVTLIGQPTNGLTSFNQTFTLNKDYTINLTTSVIKDRTGKVYKIAEGVSPDVFIDLPKDITRSDFVKPEIKKLYMDAANEHIESLSN